MADKAKKLKSGNYLTPPFRVSFPAVFRPTKPKGAPAEQESKYVLTMLFPKGTDLSLLKKAAEEAARERFGDKIPKNLRSPFHDQGEKEYEGYEEGAPYITATSKQRPGLVDASNQDIIDEEEFYPGCWARATLRPFAYGGKDTSFRPGVSFGLQNVQKLKDDEPFGMAKADPSDEFEPLEGEPFDGDGEDEGSADSLFD